MPRIDAFGSKLGSNGPVQRRSREWKAMRTSWSQKPPLRWFLLGALLGIIGAYMIWGAGGVLLFVGSALLAFGLTGK